MLFNRPSVSATFMCRDYKSINVNELSHDLSRVSWDDCWFCDTVDKNLPS